MPTNATQQKAYKDARTALNNIARSLKATRQQVGVARTARRKLTLDYIGKNIAAVEDRTQQYESFIADMETVIRRIGANSPIRALGTLTAIVDRAKAAVG